MPEIKAFKGYRPRAEIVDEVHAPPYDVIDSNQARSLAGPNSFLHITKPEIDLEANQNPYSLEVYKKGNENLEAFLKKKVFVRDDKSAEEMSYWQLKRYAERAITEGYDATRNLVDMNIKISFPFIIFILILIGIPVALGIDRGGTPVAVSVGIGLCFLYMVFLINTQSTT